jgi:2-dehydropantoate 2-reductase
VLLAATRQPIGVVRETPSSWHLFRKVLEEGVNVARAEGVALPDDLVERTLTNIAGLPPNLYSSLYDDLRAGRRMEVEALQAELSRRAEGAGVPAPATSALYAVLLPQANAGSRPSP